MGKHAVDRFDDVERTPPLGQLIRPSLPLPGLLLPPRLLVAPCARARADPTIRRGGANGRLELWKQVGK